MRRVNIARRLANLTYDRLASKTGLHVARIKELCITVKKPSRYEASLIALATGMPVSFVGGRPFQQQVITYPDSERSYSDSIFDVMRMSMVAELVERLESDGIEFPQVRLYDKADVQTNDHIAAIANSLRSDMNIGLGPIPNVLSLVELQGVIVAVMPLDSDAYIARVGERLRPVIFVGDHVHGHARRIAVLREFVRLVLPHPEDTGYARRLALAFLFPRETYAPTMQGRTTVHELQEACAKWRAPTSALFQRSKHLGLIPYDLLSRLSKEVGDDGDTATDQPSALRKVREMIGADRFCDLASECGINWINRGVVRVDTPCIRQ